MVHLQVHACVGERYQGGTWTLDELVIRYADVKCSGLA